MNSSQAPTSIDYYIASFSPNVQAILENVGAPIRNLALNAVDIDKVRRTASGALVVYALSTHFIRRNSTRCHR